MSFFITRRFWTWLELWERERQIHRQRQRRRTRTQADVGLLYWSSLNPRCDSISRVLHHWCFDKRFSPSVCRGPHVPRLGTHQPLSESDCFLTANWQRLTIIDRSVWGYPCICNFITSTYAFWFKFQVICLYPRIACFPVIPNWRLCQRKINMQHLFQNVNSSLTSSTEVCFRFGKHSKLNIAHRFKVNMDHEAYLTLSLSLSVRLNLLIDNVFLLHDNGRPHTSSWFGWTIYRILRTQNM